jgi:hypothetical protein
MVKRFLKHHNIIIFITGLKTGFNLLMLKSLNGLNCVDDPSKLYSYQSGNAPTLKGYVVPRRGFAAANNVADADINARLKNKYHLFYNYIM